MKALSVFMALTLGLLIFEVGLRIGYGSHPTFLRADEVLGISFRPWVAGWTTYEGHGYIRMNGEGLHDRPHAVAKPRGTFRVAVVGDSMVAAAQLPYEKGLCANLEAGLRACQAPGGKEVEVLNFGNDGAGTGDELLMLRTRVWKYDPDVVLLAFCVGNDLLNNSQMVKDYDRPRFIERDGELVLDNSFRETRGYKIRSSWMWRTLTAISDYSCILQVINVAKNKVRANMTKEFAVEPSQIFGIYRELSDPEWVQTWSVTERLILTMRNEVTRKGARFGLVVLGDPIQVHPDRVRREQMEARMGVPDLFYASRRLAVLGSREAFPVLCINPPMQAYAEAHRAYLHGFGQDLGNGHYNGEGHHVAARLISDWACRKVLGAPSSQDRSPVACSTEFRGDEYHRTDYRNGQVTFTTGSDGGSGGGHLWSRAWRAAEVGFGGFAEGLEDLLLKPILFGVLGVRRSDGGPSRTVQMAKNQRQPIRGL